MFHELPPHLDREVAHALKMGAEEAANRARTHHDYEDRTGTLTNSIDSDGPNGSFSGGDLQAIVSAGAEYALYVDKGTKPHKIKPRYRSSLRWPIEGGFMFSGEVNHPGTAPTLFLEKAVEAVEPRIEQQLLPDAVELAFTRAGFR